MKNTLWSRAFILIILMGSIAVPANARIAVNWVWDMQRAQPVVMGDGVTLLPVNSTIQLIWSPDGTMGPLNFADPLTPTGGDVLLDTKGNDNVGWWDFSVSYYDGGGTYVGGYVYQRVFAVSLGSSPTLGTHYGTGLYMSTGLVDADGSPTPPPDNSFLWSSAGLPFVLNGVPEPSSITFCLIGLSIVLFKRQNNKNAY